MKMEKERERCPVLVSDAQMVTMDLHFIRRQCPDGSCTTTCAPEQEACTTRQNIHGTWAQLAALSGHASDACRPSPSLMLSRYPKNFNLLASKLIYAILHFSFRVEQGLYILHPFYLHQKVYDKCVVCVFTARQRQGHTLLLLIN